jgi:hypothetical protein
MANVSPKSSVGREGGVEGFRNEGAGGEVLVGEASGNDGGKEMGVGGEVGEGLTTHCGEPKAV